MPFKLKLKKSRHYSVVSKSLFVISVELLDGTNIECTLSSESTGQDCLDVVCQKLGLHQPKFFGLQYMSKARDTLTWLELERPIKRQLDKHARHLYVYLRVMYYVVSGVRLFNDEVTRNHYFLQLKMDVIEGRINCTPAQSVELASFCMQAEFGNYDAERHTAHYLKDFQLFPKCCTDPDYLEKLTDVAIRQHAALHNVPQGTAEEYYICACQRLDGYGQETYNAKDRTGEDVIVAVSLTGVTISYPSGRNGKSYGWVDIRNVINNKRDFTIESVVESDKGEVFHFPDIESAKNAWMFCVLQHTFYRQHENSVVDQTDNTKPTPNFHQTIVEVNKQPSLTHLRPRDSYEDVSIYEQSTGSLAQRAQSTSCLDLNTNSGESEQLRSLLPSYRQAPDYETAVQQKYRNSASALQTAHQQHNTQAIVYSSQPEIREYASHLRYPDVTHNNIESKNLMANLYGAGYTTQSQILSTNEAHLSEQMRHLHLCKPPPPYSNNRISSNSTPDLAGIGMSPMSKPTNALFLNNIVSGSSPDLVSTGNFVNQHHYMKFQHQPMYNNMVHRSQSYLPPQHGTYENLASIFNNNMLGGRPHQAVIVENPNITKHIKKVYDEHGNIIYCMPSNMKQILEDNQLASTQGFVVTRNAIVANNPADLHKSQSQEPIYENIPLTWQQEASNGGMMRARTQSIQSAPEVTASNQVAAQVSNSSKENLYANISRTGGATTSNMIDHLNNSSGSNVTANSTATIDSSPNTMSRTSTFIINKNSSSLNSSASSHHFTNTTDSGNISNDTFTTDASSTSGSVQQQQKKKKRWGVFMGRSKSSEKVKSATLGREKEKKDKNQSNNRHRWSTGLPRLALPPSISKETMCQLLENKLADNQLFFEFDKIPKKKQNANFTTALLPDTQALNRFQDVLPYEDNRIKLTPTRDNKYGYINASHITATVGSKQRFYIAAQGPTRVTLPHFWQCVWESEVYLVVQLTEANEDMTYIPDSRGRSIDVGQDYQILWEFSQKTGHCVTSKVRLCHVMTRRYRTLWHLHYTDWGDQGCPRSVAHFLGFLEELQSVQLHSMEEIPPGHNKNPPVLVHCTAGVGRTGLTLLCDLLLYTVDHNQEVDIPRVVGLLRHQRPYMVQTISQYRFVYSLLIHYIKQNRLI